MTGDTQQQQRMPMNGIGPIHNYHSIRSRPSPYQTNEIKQHININNHQQYQLKLIQTL